MFKVGDLVRPTTWAPHHRLDTRLGIVIKIITSDLRRESTQPPMPHQTLVVKWMYPILSVAEEHFWQEDLELVSRTPKP